MLASGFWEKSEGDAPLMCHQDTVSYAENSDMQAVALASAGGQPALLVLLPRTIGACDQIENSLNPANLHHWLSQMEKREGDLYFRRFKTESEFGLASGSLARCIRSHP
jgi:serine protease inhibitor